MHHYFPCNIKQIFFSAIFAIMLTGCTEKKLQIGTVSGVETEIMKQVKTVALQDHRLRLKIVEFSDYRLLNAALNDGGIDANIFQHRPYFEEELKHKQYQLVSLGETFSYSMGIYSERFTHLKDITKQAIVGIPDDLTNQARALRLLEQAGLIKLDIDAKQLVTPKAVRYNPKALRFKAIEASQLTHALYEQVDLAVINMNYAIASELSPSHHALFKEKPNPAYANLIVVRKEDQDNQALKQLVAAYHDEQVLAYVQDLLKSDAVVGRRGGESGIRTRGRF